MYRKRLHSFHSDFKRRKINLHEDVRCPFTTGDSWFTEMVWLCQKGNLRLLTFLTWKFYIDETTPSFFEIFFYFLDVSCGIDRSGCVILLCARERFIFALPLSKQAPVVRGRGRDNAVRWIILYPVVALYVLLTLIRRATFYPSDSVIRPFEQLFRLLINLKYKWYGQTVGNLGKCWG